MLAQVEARADGAEATRHRWQIATGRVATHGHQPSKV
jgi:hypothetical protein